MFGNDPLEEIRKGQFLHATIWNWLLLGFVFSCFPLGLYLAKVHPVTYFYILLSIELLLMVCSILWLIFESRRAIFVTTFLLLLSVSLIHSFAVIYSLIGICSGGCITESPTISNDLYSAIYFSIVSWTTLGYGDFQPVEWGRLVAAIEALIGYIFMGVVIGFSAQITFEIVRNSHTTQSLRKSLSQEVGYEGSPEE